MAQHDFVIANQGFPATRSDINNFLQAVATTHSGTSTPSGAVAGTIWLDTTTATAPILKYYDGTDNITLATIDHVANTVNFSDSAFDLITDTTPQLGGNLDVNGNSIVSTSNANITLTPNGTGDVVLSADTVKIGDLNANATITTDGTGDLILNTNSGSSSGSITIADGADANITIEPNGTGDILLNADTVRVGDSGANATITSNGAGDLILNTNSGTTSGSITIADGANGNITIAGNGTGQIIVNAGAVGTPTIAPTGDTNTGIFFPSADTIAFTEGGTEAMRIDSDGDVGINTTSPETKLHVKATSDLLAPITVEGTTSNGFNLISGRHSTNNSTVNIGVQWSGAGMVLGSYVKPSTSSDSDATGYLSSYNVGSVRRSAIVLNGDGIIKFLNTSASATVAVDTAVAMSERMRITSAGDLLYSTTSVSPHFNGDGLQITEDGRLLVGQSGQLCAIFGRNTSNGEMIRFDRSGTDVGSIDVTTTATSYNTSSDYRLKENVNYNFDATTRLKQLKPARFNFKTEQNKTVDGFIAHEVQSVIPEAITGTKDETETKEKVVVNNIGQVVAENIEQADWETGKIPNEEGKSQYPIDSTWEASKVVPVYQGIDQAKLTPLLTKALQEAIAKIEQLEARLTALES